MTEKGIVCSLKKNMRCGGVGCGREGETVWGGGGLAGSHFVAITISVDLLVYETLFSAIFFRRRIC